MLKIIFLMVAISVSFSSLKADLPPLSHEESKSFQNQIDQALKKAEQQVESAKYSATRKDIAPTTFSKIELQNALVQLDVKKTLVNNFKGTESLGSPLVRRKLIEILNKTLITPADLADLQGLVLEEKAKMRASQVQTTPAPSQLPN